MEEREKEEKEEKKGRKLSFVDKRRVGKDDPNIKAAEPSLKPTYIEELEGKVKLAETKLREKVAMLDEEAKRSRERVTADLERRFEEKETSLLTDVLEILDDLDRAAQYADDSPRVKEGFSLVASRLSAFMQRHGCEKISPCGEPFDPQTMEAVQVLPGQKDTVVAVLAPGTIKGGRVIRPAKVAVGRGE